ncbi:MAG: Maf family protein [Caldilineales bacterium]|nr:Maf family protein [Caldilineales bacterium]
MPLILASASPRRRQLLACLTPDFVIAAADIDESALPAEAPADHARRLAETKARVVAGRHPGEIVLAADTIVVLAGQILGKPAGAADARRMLSALRLAPHQVISAVAVAQPGRLNSALHTSQVTMRDYTDAEIDAYIASGDPFDKAGAYAIQHAGFSPVASFDGCAASIMGLPLPVTATLLQAAGVGVTPGWPVACQTICGRCCRQA